jgi:glyoxylase I family protein
MIKQLAHACINTRDLKGTERFYCEVLGCERGFEFLRENRLFGFYLKLGGNTFIEVFEGNPGEPGNINHLALEVDDIDEAIRRIKAHGHKIGEKKLGCDKTWQVWLEDPNGVKIELQQYTPESLQFTGGTCVANW